MDLSKYLQYAAVTSPIVLAIIFLSLTFKSWLDRVVFRKNTAYAAAMQNVMLRRMFDDDEDFDRHVESTPGMQNLN
jgi:hypothetical protein